MSHISEPTLPRWASEPPPRHFLCSCRIFLFGFSGESLVFCFKQHWGIVKDPPAVCVRRYTADIPVSRGGLFCGISIHKFLATACYLCINLLRKKELCFPRKQRLRRHLVCL